VNFNFDPLLALQAIDLAIMAQENEVKALIPNQIQAGRLKIQTISQAYNQAQSAYQACQEHQLNLEKKIQQEDEALLRFKTQQATVKKLEEHTALAHQMATTQAKIANLEDEGVALLMDLDKMKINLDAHLIQKTQQIDLIEKEIGLLEARLAQLHQELAGHQAQRIRARSIISPGYLEAYEHIQQKKIRSPWVVPMIEGYCQGCHLKLSQEGLAGLMNPEKPSFCENCGRLLYIYS